MGNSCWSTKELIIMLYVEIKRININVGGVPSLGFAGGNEELNRIANAVGYALPDVYLRFIGFADGGHPEVGSFAMPNGDSGGYFDVDWFYSVSNFGVEKVQHVIDGWGEKLGSGALPIGRDAGGNQIYLDLRDAPPTVWLYLHDEHERRLKIAENLEIFISGLQVNPDFI